MPKDPRSEPFEELAEMDVHQPLGVESAQEPGEVRPGSTEPDESEARRLQRERDEYYDQLLRAAAEFDNFRKRVERERHEMATQAAASLIRELLPIVDDFERALQAEAGGGADAYRRGVEMIHERLLELLRRHGVEPIEAVGADFDPHVHEAVVHETSPGHREGEVMEEFRRGYKLGDRLLRPAMVKVAKA